MAFNGRSPGRSREGTRLRSGFVSTADGEAAGCDATGEAGGDEEDHAPAGFTPEGPLPIELPVALLEESSAELAQLGRAVAGCVFVDCVDAACDELAVGSEPNPGKGRCAHARSEQNTPQTATRATHAVACPRLSRERFRKVS